MAARASAQVERVTLTLDGLSCPFCVYNVEKQVKKIGIGLDPTHLVQSDLNKGIVWFAWNPDVAFSPDRVHSATKDSGFTLRETRLRAGGAVRLPASPAPDSLLIVRSKLSVVLKPDERADRLQAWQVLRGHALDSGAGFAVQVEGRVEAEDSGDGWRLVLEGWSPVEFGAVVDMEIDALGCEKCSTRTMKALQALEGVIYAQAEHEADEVLVWTSGAHPDEEKFRAAVETLGFKVKHIHAKARDTTPPAQER